MSFDPDYQPALIMHEDGSIERPFEATPLAQARYLRSHARRLADTGSGSWYRLALALRLAERAEALFTSSDGFDLVTELRAALRRRGRPANPARRLEAVDFAAESYFADLSWAPQVACDHDAPRARRAGGPEVCLACGAAMVAG